MTTQEERRFGAAETAPMASQSSSSDDATTCIFDLFIDLPHPSASPTCQRAKIIEPPGRVHPDISELYDPSNMSRIPKFAFPDYDESIDSGMYETIIFTIFPVRFRSHRKVF